MGAPATAELAARAHDLRARHRPGRPLVLPNAWDVATARAVVAAGFPVVATTSAGVVASSGSSTARRTPRWPVRPSPRWPASAVPSTSR